EPTTQRIHAALGTAAPAWDLLVALVEESGMAIAWRYYRDGGWLAKVTRGSTTVAWVNVAPGCVRATSYFVERDRAGIVGDPALPASVRDRVAVVAPIGKSIPVSLEARTSEDVGTIGTVLRLKLGALKRPRAAAH
ncbi:MAG TPA: DUF3788 family protein, partial [Propionicimonas sp.]